MLFTFLHSDEILGFADLTSKCILAVKNRDAGNFRYRNKIVFIIFDFLSQSHRYFSQ